MGYGHAVRVDREAAVATAWGLFASALVTAGIYFGSRELRDFDSALVPYAGATVFSAFGLGYRYAMWLGRPPTRMYWRRGWQLFLAPRRLPRNLLRVGRLIWDNLLAQRFIERRSPLRWAAHAGIFWGCLLAALITFPLSFGWAGSRRPPIPNRCTRPSSSEYESPGFHSTAGSRPSPSTCWTSPRCWSSAACRSRCGDALLVLQAIAIHRLAGIDYPL